MSSVSQLQARLRSIDVSGIAARSLDENRNEIVSAQQEQLARGERKDGSKIGKYKSAKYAAIKATLNPLAGFGNVDLILTGAFKNDIFIDVRESTIVIDSADSKAADLFKKYGDALGLGYKARVKVIAGGLKKTFTNNIKKDLHL